MGKGIIVSGGADGAYEIDMVYDISRITLTIARIDTKIAEIDEALPEASEYNSAILSAQRAGLVKAKATLGGIPENKRLSVWSADLTQDLSGAVGLIEVPDALDGVILIRPGHGGSGAYVALRDGIANPVLNMGPASTFFNRAIMPGVQKYKPNYRFGEITSKDGDLCDLTLLEAKDENGISVNQSVGLAGVPIEYMTCNGAAFKVGDTALISFNRDWNTPKVVGFRSDPKPCGEFLYIQAGAEAIVWDMSTNAYAVGILNGSGDPITMPSTPSELSAWRASTGEISKNSFWTPTVIPVSIQEIPDTIVGECDGEALTDTASRETTRTHVRTYPVEGTTYFYHDYDDETVTENYTWTSGTYSFGGNGPQGRCLEGVEDWFEDGLITITREYNSLSTAHYEFTNVTGPIIIDICEATLVQGNTDVTLQLVTPLGNGPSYKTLGSAESHGVYDLDQNACVLEGSSDINNMDGYTTYRLKNTETAIVQIYVGDFRAKTTDDAIYWDPVGPHIYDVLVSTDVVEDGIAQSGYALKNAPLNPVLGAWIKGALTSAQAVSITAEFRQ